ncbi:hypothetical protein UFOVP253_15 [uncultured Caudovirales phage]|uniref:Uncharacterized protein n=1 Tax=uncultured Caudovirales phage TaxID=2100421 RepID=A0A6J5LED5_9CAUD|nr:hypothetical protein UFOVP253_15 [uncultured Caudovirales phage]
MEIPEANVKRLNVHLTKLNNVNVLNVEATAYKLEEKLHDTHSFNFFCKVARNLPENVIWSEAEKALTKGRNPAAYFTVACSAIMAKQ